MSEQITDLGEIGAVGIGLLRPLILNLNRDDEGSVWDLTGYDQPTLLVWRLRDGATVTPGGNLVISDDATGEVTYTPSQGDAIFSESGYFEARVTVRPGSGDPEPSGLFRFRIGGR